MIPGARKARQLAHMTWEEVRDLDRKRCVAILPVAAIEAHGPHLPLATDVVIAVAMARAGAAEIETGGVTAVILPPLAYTTAVFASGFPGTVSLAPETVTGAVVDVARSLHRHGFGALAIANAHLDPDHLAALHAAVDGCRVAGLLPVVFPDITRRPWGMRLTDEFRSGACHAGRFEASIVMAERPELVRETVRAALPPNPVSLSEAILARKRSFEEAGGPRAYFGDPAAASRAEGEATITALGTILADAVAEAGVGA